LLLIRLSVKSQIAGSEGSADRSLMRRSLLQLS